MATNYFTTESIALSMKNPETGAFLTSNVYELAGVTNVDGTPKQMSIGQLVMAVCLSRATELESKIVAEMAEMAETTDKLEYLSKIEADIAAWQKANPTETLKVYNNEGNEHLKTMAIDGNLYPNLYALFYENDGKDLTQFLSDIGMDTSATSWTTDEVDEMMQNVEELMDSKNTLSQEQLIDIQSLTSKRDDTYSLISNVLKSLYTVMTGNVNNI